MYDVPASDQDEKAEEIAAIVVLKSVKETPATFAIAPPCAIASAVFMRSVSCST